MSVVGTDGGVPFFVAPSEAARNLPSVTAKAESDKKSRKTAYAFALMVALMTGMLAVQSFYINQNRDLTKQNRVLIGQVRNLAEQGREAKLGICSYKTDLGERILAGTDSLGRAQQYLKDHPQGAPGIPRAAILASIKSQQNSLRSQKAAYRALGVLHGCDPSLSDR